MKNIKLMILLCGVTLSSAVASDGNPVEDENTVVAIQEIAEKEVAEQAPAPVAQEEVTEPVVAAEELPLEEEQPVQDDATVLEDADGSDFDLDKLLKDLEQ